MHDKIIYRFDKICKHFKHFVLQLLLNTFTVDNLDIDKFEQILIQRQK